MKTNGLVWQMRKYFLSYTHTSCKKQDGEIAEELRTYLHDQAKHPADTCWCLPPTDWKCDNPPFSWVVGGLFRSSWVCSSLDRVLNLPPPQVLGDQLRQRRTAGPQHSPLEPGERDSRKASITDKEEWEEEVRNKNLRSYSGGFQGVCRKEGKLGPYTEK